MRAHCFFEGGYASNCYLVTDEGGAHAAVIDPSLPPERVLTGQPDSLRVEYIILTHAHFDHMLALDEWRTVTGAPLLVHAHDAAALSDPRLSCYRSFLGQDKTFAPADRLLSGGEVLALGKESLTVIETPGHTRGSICLDSGAILFTGDTVFSDGSFGRYDLPGGDGDRLIMSLSDLLMLRGERRLLAGHGDEGLVSEVKKFYNFS